MHIDPYDLRFASMVIGSEVKSLLSRGVLRRDERENFASELMARLLDVWDTYDPERGPREAFVNIVVSSQVASLLREKYAQKRCGKSRPLCESDELVLDRASSDGRQQHSLNLRIDLAGIISRLTPLQVELVDRLQRDSLAPIAEQMGIPRRTLRDQCARIREIFRDAGLEEYL